MKIAGRSFRSCYDFVLERPVLTSLALLIVVADAAGTVALTWYLHGPIRDVLRFIAGLPYDVVTSLIEFAVAAAILAPPDGEIAFSSRAWTYVGMLFAIDFLFTLVDRINALALLSIGLTISEGVTVALVILQWFIMVRLALLLPLIVCGRGIVAIAMSWRLTKGNFWRILLIFVLATLPARIINYSWLFFGAWLLEPAIDDPSFLSAIKWIDIAGAPLHAAASFAAAMLFAAASAWLFKSWPIRPHATS